ncbi:hypothetical protein HN747_00665 [archaeon]|jgi:hypothetical protein|nr:hypothetical protein [archaeon]
MNKKAIIGSGISTVVATILILLILVIFTVGSIGINKLSGTKTKSYELESKTYNTPQTESERYFYRTTPRDDMNKYYSEKILTEEIKNILEGGDETLLSMAHKLNNNNAVEIANRIEQSNVISTWYLDITKDDTTIICRTTECKVRVPEYGKVFEFIKNRERYYPYIELNFTNSKIILSTKPIEDVDLRREKSYCNFIGEGNQC